MSTIELFNSFDESSSHDFKLEDFFCKKHRQPTGAVCGADFCEMRLLCNDCIKEHEFSHFHDIMLGYTFSKSYVFDKVNLFLKERIPILNQHEKMKDEMKRTFKAAVDKFKTDILTQFEELEYYVNEVIDESTNHTEKYEELKEHMNSIEQILQMAKDTKNLENTNIRHYLNEYKSLMRIIDNMKDSFNYEKLQIIVSNTSNEFVQGVKQSFSEFKNSWVGAFKLARPHDLGTFLKAKPKLLQVLNDKITGITFSEQDRTVAVLEGSHKIHFYNDIHNFDRNFFRLGFSRFEDCLSQVKWGDNSSLLICNNNHKWVKLHYPSKTYSTEISTAPEGPIRKIDFFPELKILTATTEYWVICYQAGQTFTSVYYKIYCGNRISDLCLIKEKNIALLAVGNASGHIVIHDVINRTEKYQFKAHQHGVVTVKYWSEKKLLITTGQQGDLKIWKMVDGGFKCLQRVCYEYGFCITEIIIVPTNGLIIAVYNDRSFIVYNVYKNRKVGIKKMDTPIISPVYVKEAGKILFGLEKGLYQLKV